MAAAQTLEDVANSISDEDALSIFGTKKTGGFVNPFTIGVCFPVEIVDQEVNTTKNGYTQVVIKMGILGSDGMAGNGGKVWLSLPVFSEEKKASEDLEKLKVLRSAFGERFHKFLRAIDPSTFAVSARSEKIGRTWKFFDADGNEMSNAAKTARELKVGKLVLETAAQVEAGTYSLVGKRCYYVRTQDKSKADKFYDNFYSVPSTIYPMAEV